MAISENNASESGWWHSHEAGRFTTQAEPEGRGIDHSRVDLTLRSFWIDEGWTSEQTSATALGGFLAVTTPAYYNVSAKLAVYTSQRLNGINPSRDSAVNPSPYDGTRSFTYFGEAAFRFDRDALFAEAGRIKVETPFADADDIRMVPNTFEGFHAAYDGIADTSLHLLCLTRWAGVDSADAEGEQSRFRPLGAGSDGMAAAGADYAPDEGSEYTLWYYGADRLFDLVYAEADGHLFFTKPFHVEWGVQLARMSARDGSMIGGTVFGAMALLHYERIYFGGAYNYAAVTAGESVTDGFGSGPYYTSLDASTLGSVSGIVPGHDVSVYRIGVGADVSWWPHAEDEGVHLEAVHGGFDLASSAAAVKEDDVLLWLGWSEALRIDAIAAWFDIENSPDPEYKDFNRFIVRVDYAF